MKLPATPAVKRMRKLIKLRATDYSVRRETTDTGRFGEEDPNASSSTHNVSAWLYMPSEEGAEQEFGTLLTGSLRGVAMPSEDIEEGDVFTHLGTEYEVVEIEDVPRTNKQSPERTIQLFGLTKRTNE